MVEAPSLASQTFTEYLQQLYESLPDKVDYRDASEVQLLRDAQIIDQHVQILATKQPPVEFLGWQIETCVPQNILTVENTEEIDLAAQSNDIE